MNTAIALVVAALLAAQDPGTDGIQALRRQAAELIREERMADLLALMARARQMAPRDAEFARYEAEALFALQRHEEAVRAFRAAEELDPASAGRTFNHGLALMKLNRLGEARDRFETLAARGADASFRAKGRFGVGLVLSEQGDERAAAEAFAAALALDASLTRARYRLGAAEIRAGRPAEGISHLQRVLAEEPLHAGAAYNIAQAFRDLGDDDQAAVWRRRFGELREIGNAIDNAKIRLQADPDSVEALLALAEAQSRGGAKREAMGACARAIRIAPAHPGARLQAARLLADLGDAPAARRQYEALIALHGAPPEAFLEYAGLCEKAGEHEKAAELRRRAESRRQPGR